MTIKEARAIVRKMIHWTMLGQGIEIKYKPEPITEDLATLLKANKMVERANKRGSDRISKIVKEKGAWKGSRSVQMTIAVRGIAALYVAANFRGDAPETADVLGLHFDNMVVCLDRRYLKNDD